MASFSDGAFSQAAFSILAFDIGTPLPPPPIPLSKGLVGNQSTGNGITTTQSTSSSLTGKGSL